MDWFLYDLDLKHERVNPNPTKQKKFKKLFLVARQKKYFIIR